MAIGKSGTFVITNTANSALPMGSTRFTWSEDYDISSNTSTVSITKMEMLCSGDGYGNRNYGLGNLWFNGSVSINGVGVASVSRGSAFLVVPVYGQYTNAQIQNPSLPWKTTVTHNNDGTGSTTISISLHALSSNNDARTNTNIVGSTTITLTTIPRASTITSASNITLGNNCSIAISASSTDFWHKIKFSLGEWSYTTSAFRPTSLSYSYTGYTVPESVSNQIPNSKTGTMTAVLTTYSDQACTVQNGNASQKSFTVTVPSYSPQFSNSSISLDNSASQTIASWGIAVSGYTKAVISATATGKWGSTISRYDISGSVSASISGSTLSWTSGILTDSGTITFNITCTDSRGYTSSVIQKTIQCYAYSNPFINTFSAARTTSDSTKISLTASWSFSSLDNRNTTTAVIKYKQKSESAWSDGGYIQNNQTTILSQTFDDATSYDFRLIITDSLGNSVESLYYVSTAEVLINLRAGGKGLGIGKISESDSLEIALETRFANANIKILVNGSYVDLADYIRRVIYG